MDPVVKVILEVLGGGIALGVLIKLRRSGCWIKKKSNSCDCSIQADLDGDGNTDVDITISGVKEDHFRSESKVSIRDDTSP